MPLHQPSLRPKGRLFIFMKLPTIAAIEAGGTKFVISVCRGDQLGKSIIVPTSDPDNTLSSAVAFIETELHGSSLDAVGIASFGPVDVDSTSMSFGAIGSTPKLGWAGVNLRQYFHTAFNCPVGIESDVNGAALAEATWDIERPFNHLAYVTVGTGIGVGIVQSGCISNGTSHPEIGHIRVPRHAEDVTFAGVCPFHGDCLEGLASGPAIFERWQATLSDLDQHHVAHDIEAFYLGQLAANIALHHRPEVIVFGGGVSQTPGLIPRIRKECQSALGGYLPILDSSDAMALLIRQPRLDTDSGIRGAYMLGKAVLG